MWLNAAQVPVAATWICAVQLQQNSLCTKGLACGLHYTFFFFCWFFNTFPLKAGSKIKLFGRLAFPAARPDANLGPEQPERSDPPLPHPSQGGSGRARAAPGGFAGLRLTSSGHRGARASPGGLPWGLGEGGSSLPSWCVLCLASANPCKRGKSVCTHVIYIIIDHRIVLIGRDL